SGRARGRGVGNGTARAGEPYAVVEHPVTGRRDYASDANHIGPLAPEAPVPAPMETVKPPTPELVGPSAPEAPAPPPAPEAPPAPGFVRVYHAGADPALGGPRWVHPDEQYVRDFR